MARYKQEDIQEQVETMISEATEKIEEPIQAESEVVESAQVIPPAKEGDTVVAELAPAKVEPVVVTPLSQGTVIGVPRNSKKSRILRNMK